MTGLPMRRKCISMQGFTVAFSRMLVGISAPAVTRGTLARHKGKSMGILGPVRLAAVAVAAMLFIAGAHAQQQQQQRLKLTIGTEGAYPPFNSVSADGSLVGFDIDIAKALCEEMRADCTFVTQNWEGIIPALQAGRFDAIVSSMAATDERRRKVDFTRVYYRTVPAIVVPKNSTIAGVRPDDLEGRSIGVRESTVHFRYAKAKYKKSEIRKYQRIAGYEKDLSEGSLDAAIENRLVLDAWLKTDAGQCCRILGTIDRDPEIHGGGAAIAVRRGDTDLVNRFNAALAAIRTNGTYARISDRYFGFDIYGG
jgi:polar amino acid transport system substrate-binding protein